MNAKNSALLIISVVVCVVILASTMLPAIQTSTEKTARIGNTGSYFAAVDSSGTIHTISIATGQGSFVIKTDDKVDITPSMGTYNPGGVYVAPAIAYGVYEAYSDNGVLTSQAGVTPSDNTIINNFRTEALAGNTDVTTGTYQLMNWFNWEGYQLMAITIMGSMDSRYMMGTGNATNTYLDTGTVSQAYVKSTSDSAVAMLLENAWGNKIEGLGDIGMLVADRSVYAGNTLGGHNLYINSIEVQNILDNVILPDATSTDKVINAIDIADALTITMPTSVKTTTGSDGEINNILDISTSANRYIRVGGGSTSFAPGLFMMSATKSATYSADTASGTRLVYMMTNYEPTTTDYGYVVTFGTNGNTITGVQALVDGVLTDENPTGTTLNSFWDFDTTTGVGPFGSYYALINLSSGANTDDETEPRLSTVKGEIAYILNPADWTETLAGNSFTVSEYNAMLIVPTMYWGVVDQKLYMSNDPATFADVEGLEMQPYAHTYTVDPSVDTGNPVTTASATVVYGDEYIVRLYSTGDVYLITTNNMVNLGQVSGENTVTITVTDDVLGYTPAGGSAATVDGVLAYIASSGEYAQCKNPYYSTSQTGAKFIIGGYANNLATTTEDVVDIGYCTTVTASDLSIGAITVLDPVSDASNTVSTNGAVWQESTLIESDLYKVGDLKITTTWSDTGTSTATYNYYLAPAVVEYNNPAYVDNPMWGTLIVLVGTLCLIGVVLGAVRIIGGRE